MFTIVNTTMYALMNISSPPHCNVIRHQFSQHILLGVCQSIELLGLILVTVGMEGIEYLYLIYRTNGSVNGDN